MLPHFQLWRKRALIHDRLEDHLVLVIQSHSLQLLQFNNRVWLLLQQVWPDILKLDQAFSEQQSGEFDLRLGVLQFES